MLCFPLGMAVRTSYYIQSPDRAPVHSMCSINCSHCKVVFYAIHHFVNVSYNITPTLGPLYLDI